MKGQKGGVKMKFIRKIKYPITIIIIVLLIVSFVAIKNKLNSKKYVLDTNNNNNELTITNFEKESPEDKQTLCNVDIKGAVSNPGVYSVECNKTINDIISLAGGLTENANTSVNNLAKKVTDEMVIIIYTDEEIKNSNIVDTVVKYIDKECNCPNIKNDGCINDKITGEIGNGTGTSNIININTASLEELQKLSGIGASKAESIIKYREKVGKFKSINELLEVDGIGEKLYEEIKDSITV